MVITAKFDSRCPNCSRAIKSGEKVEWSRGNKAAHVTCAISAAHISTPAPRTSGRRYGSGAGYAGHGVPGYSNYCTDRPGCGCYDCAS